MFANKESVTRYVTFPISNKCPLFHSPYVHVHVQIYMYICVTMGNLNAVSNACNTLQYCFPCISWNIPQKDPLKWQSSKAVCHGSCLKGPPMRIRLYRFNGIRLHIPMPYLAGNTLFPTYLTITHADWPYSIKNVSLSKEHWYRHWHYREVNPSFALLSP